MKYFNKELNEEVERLDFNPNGFCMCCGEPMRKPKKVNEIWVCVDCFKVRTEDVMTLNKHFVKEIVPLGEQ